MQTLQIVQILPAGLTAGQDQQGALPGGGLVPQQGAPGIRHHLIAGSGLRLGKALPLQGVGIFTGKDAGLGHLQLGGHPSADAGGGVQGIQGVVILLHPGQMLGHGAVNAPVHRGHHVADEIRSVHGRSSYSCLTAAAGRCIISLKFMYTLQLKVSFKSRAF